MSEAWDTRKDPVTEAMRHSVSPGLGHAVLGPLVANIFHDLGVSASLCHAHGEWFPIYVEPSVLSFENAQLKDKPRAEHNGRCLARVRATRQSLLAEHAGFWDLFVPIFVGDQLTATLVTGPFLRARPTAADVLTRWEWLTGRRGYLADPQFAGYLAANLRTLVLEGDRDRAFQRLVVCLAELMSGRGEAGALASEADELRVELEKARFVERAWSTVAAMVDERSSEAWRSARSLADLIRVGLDRPANAVLVGLVSSSDSDPVDEAIRRDAFQRRMVALARSSGNALCGQVGEHGIVLLSGSPGSAARRRQRLVDLSERVQHVAQRDFGFSVHFGVADAPAVVPLENSFHAALAAAELAVVQNRRLNVAEPNARPAHSLRHLRDEIGQRVLERPELLRARFDRYLEAVGSRAGYRLEPLQVHLEYGFDKLAEAIRASHAIDDKSWSSLRDALDHSATAARTVGELFTVYRSAVADLVRSLEAPAAARHDRNLRRGIEYMRSHYFESVTRDAVAHVAGLNPSYFSVLFKRREGKTFEQSLRDLRVQRAQQLLGGGDLSVTRVAELTGFQSLAYFSRVFRKSVGVSARAFRLRAASAPLRQRQLKYKPKQT